MTNKMKDLIWDMVYDVDNHQNWIGYNDDETLKEEDCVWFYNKYLKPIIEENNRTVGKGGSIA